MICTLLTLLRMQHPVHNPKNLMNCKSNCLLFKSRSHDCHVYSSFFFYLVSQFNFWFESAPAVPLDGIQRIASFFVHFSWSSRGDCLIAGSFCNYSLAVSRYIPSKYARSSLFILVLLLEGAYDFEGAYLVKFDPTKWDNKKHPKEDELLPPPLVTDVDGDGLNGT